MPSSVISEEELLGAERLRGQGDFGTALLLTQEMLSRVQDDGTRMRLLFDILCCSTRLCLEKVTGDALAELEKLPEPAMSRFFADFIQAMSYIEHRQAQAGLFLIEANLMSEYMSSDNFQIWKYKHLAYKGRALIWLAQPNEALASLEEAHMMFPEGERETEILVDKANCLLALDQYNEAYDTASHVPNRGDEELATLAMQHMAECRMWQGRVQESLAVYNDILKRLPCRLVDEARIREGVRNGMAYLEKRRPHGKPT